MPGSQRGHAAEWQVCLAHLPRDAKYAIEDGDTAFSAPFRLLLLRTIAIGRRRATLTDGTPRQYLYDLNRRLDRIIVAIPVGERGRKLRKRMLANRTHLFVFLTNRAEPYTNNTSERHLRPSVIFRNVTNGSVATGAPRPMQRSAPSSALRRQTYPRKPPSRGGVSNYGNNADALDARWSFRRRSCRFRFGRRTDPINWNQTVGAR